MSALGHKQPLNILSVEGLVSAISGPLEQQLQRVVSKHG
jgi:hypothetical protein